MRHNATVAVLHLEECDSTRRSREQILEMGLANEMVQRMVAKGAAHAHYKDEHGKTPLFAAAASGSIKSAQLVLDKILEELPEAQRRRAVDAAHTSSKKTPLLAAVERRDGILVHALLAAGADVNKADRDGVTPLHAACSANDLPLACLLVEFGASISMLTRRRKLPLDCNPLIHFQTEVMERKSRKDVVIVCSADPMESSFAFWLTNEISSRMNIGAASFPVADTFRKRKRITSDGSEDADQRIQRHIRHASCILYILGSVSVESAACAEHLQYARQNSPGTTICVMHDDIGEMSEGLQHLLIGVSIAEMIQVASNARKHKYNAYELVGSDMVLSGTYCANNERTSGTHSKGSC